MIFEEDIDIARPPEVVFPFVGDFTNLPAWDPTVVAAAKQTDGPITLGTRYSVLMELGGRNLELEYEVLDWQPNYTATLVGTGRSVTSQDTITVRSTAGGSHVRLTAEVELRGAAKLLAPLVGSRLGSQGKKALWSLKRHLED